MKWRLTFYEGEADRLVDTSLFYKLYEKYKKIILIYFATMDWQYFRNFRGPVSENIKTLTHP